MTILFYIFLFYCAYSVFLLVVDGDPSPLILCVILYYGAKYLIDHYADIVTTLNF